VIRAAHDATASARACGAAAGVMPLTRLRGRRSWSPSSTHRISIRSESGYPATSSRVPNGSRVPWQIRVGVARATRWPVRGCAGLPGGWNGYPRQSNFDVAAQVLYTVFGMLAGTSDPPAEAPMAMMVERAMTTFGLRLISGIDDQRFRSKTVRRWDDWTQLAGRTDVPHIGGRSTADTL
jgi:hypothetical protein